MKTVSNPDSRRKCGVWPVRSLWEKSFCWLGLEFFGYVIQSQDELSCFITRHIGGK